MAASQSAQDVVWFYVDPNGVEQGPFDNFQMLGWYESGYFTMGLLLRCLPETVYTTLGDLTKKNGCSLPFTNNRKSLLFDCFAIERNNCSSESNFRLQSASCSNDSNFNTKKLDFGKNNCVVCQTGVPYQKMLTCREKHTVCEICICKLVKKVTKISKLVTCPLCNDLTVLPDGDGRKLKTKFFARLVCEDCTEEKNLDEQWWCNPCQRISCSKCSMKHHRMHDCVLWETYIVPAECSAFFKSRIFADVGDVRWKIEQFCHELKTKLMLKAETSDACQLLVQSIENGYGTLPEVSNPLNTNKMDKIIRATFQILETRGDGLNLNIDQIIEDTSTNFSRIKFPSIDSVMKLFEEATDAQSSAGSLIWNSMDTDTRPKLSNVRVPPPFSMTSFPVPNPVSVVDQTINSSSASSTEFKLPIPPAFADRTRNSSVDGSSSDFDSTRSVSSMDDVKFTEEERLSVEELVMNPNSTNSSSFSGHRKLSFQVKFKIPEELSKKNYCFNLAYDPSFGFAIVDNCALRLVKDVGTLYEIFFNSESDKQKDDLFYCSSNVVYHEIRESLFVTRPCTNEQGSYLISEHSVFDLELKNCSRLLKPNMISFDGEYLMGVLHNGSLVVAISDGNSCEIHLHLASFVQTFTWRRVFENLAPSFISANVPLESFTNLSVQTMDDCSEILMISGTQRIYCFTITKYEIRFVKMFDNLLQHSFIPFALSGPYLSIPYLHVVDFSKRIIYVVDERNEVTRNGTSGTVSVPYDSSRNSLKNILIGKNFLCVFNKINSCIYVFKVC